MDENDIAVQFVPREDITAYELALCLPYARECVGGWKVSPDFFGREDCGIK